MPAAARMGARACLAQWGRLRTLECAMGRQSDAPFKFLVRPITTVNAGSRNLSWTFEDEVFSSFESVAFSSPISGILILPKIMDSSIAVPPPDYLDYKKGDNSVSVGINIDFALWQRSSELERLGILADNIRCSLDKIQNRYLKDEDRQTLHLIVDKVQARLASRLQG
jgi:hypothetical protein